MEKLRALGGSVGLVGGLFRRGGGETGESLTSRLSTADLHSTHSSGSVLLLSVLLFLRVQDSVLLFVFEFCFSVTAPRTRGQ